MSGGKIRIYLVGYETRTLRPFSFLLKGSVD